MLPVLTEEQRQAIDQHGTPLPIVDARTGGMYILLRVEFITDPKQSEFTAHIPGIAAYGQGQSHEEAALALREALLGYMDEFGNA